MKKETKQKEAVQEPIDPKLEPKLEPVDKQKETQDLVAELLKKVEALEQQKTEDQKKLTMLEAVADKNRMYNYQNQNTVKKPIKVKLSVYQEAVIVGWKTIKDQLILNPTTGQKVGEVQEIELALLGKDDNGKYTKELKGVVNSYPAFSEARYGERLECDVVNRTEDYNGEVTFSVVLPDSQVITLNGRFVN